MLLMEQYANHSHNTSKQNQELRSIRGTYIRRIKVLSLIRGQVTKSIHNVNKTAVSYVKIVKET